ncbi:hypothetical protein CBM2605_B130122 [Cupriavidus neocaledonicus]|uniref:Transposase n=1 Tax=Cupriavidus neocaledonicus TaxID=1040979 RepID=A0ABY1V8X1_9BURK|nr:hypothetical protein CBM2605_B130122 [Cupriavidus neocaledonicus]
MRAGVRQARQRITRWMHRPSPRPSPAGGRGSTPVAMD